MRVGADGKVFRSSAEWLEVIGRFEESGQSGSEFCKSAGIVESTLYKWRKKLRPSDEPKLELIEAKIPQRLVVQDSNEPYEIRVKSGRAIIVSQSFDSTVLSELIRVVERC